MKESEGFVYPQLLRCQGQEAGMSRWPTWDVTLSGRRPKAKTPGDLNKIHHVTEIALRCQLGTGSKRCHSNVFELMDAQRHSWQDFTKEYNSCQHKVELQSHPYVAKALTIYLNKSLVDCVTL